ncbi:uncharacterized protein Bfra_004874 [Botrytis fragariae]|uniref:Uncharacterized protein n=1 Tax=Botrytis fragariae TaxID=1964551 RepID=A0A8H6ATL3_9HELO|nr:uncharacterized protein Bfra_004874 [Botrytis fragariae]KAF5873414.1 hypothetical protein Bfra_004874 [Botrytis fragariae]
MANYNSRQPEMLNRLYEEGRSNMVYRYAFKDAQNDETIALLPEQEKLQAIERTVYKKLFGDDPTDKRDATKNAKFTAEPKKNDVSVSNDGKNTEKSATTTVEKKNDTQEARDPVDSNTTKVVDGRSSSKNSPSPEEKQLTDREKRILPRHEALKAKMGPAAWHRMEEAHKKNLPIAAKREAMYSKQNKLLPMRPGASPTWECKNYWSAEDGAQIIKVEHKLNVRVKSDIQNLNLFRLWPEPADLDTFEKDPINGLELLARCEKFVEFWAWVFTSTSRVTHRVPLTTCLEWFLLGEFSPEYKEFTRLASATKPMTDVEAIEAFKQDIAANKAQHEKLGEEQTVYIKANENPRTIAQSRIKNTH